jgi:hypothetical protein
MILLSNLSNGCNILITMNSVVFYKYCGAMLYQLTALCCACYYYRSAYRVCSRPHLTVQQTEQSANCNFSV